MSLCFVMSCSRCGKAIIASRVLSVIHTVLPAMGKCCAEALALRSIPATGYGSGSRLVNPSLTSLQLLTRSMHKLLTCHQNTSHIASHHRAEGLPYPIRSRAVFNWWVLYAVSSCGVTDQVTPRSGVPCACLETRRYMFVGVRVLFIAEVAALCPVLCDLHCLLSSVGCVYSCLISSLLLRRWVRNNTLTLDRHIQRLY